MTKALASPPLPLRLSDTDISPVTPTLSRRQASAPLRAAKTQIARRHIALCFAPAAADTPLTAPCRNALLIRNRKIKSAADAKSP